MLDLIWRTLFCHLNRNGKRRGNGDATFWGTATYYFSYLMEGLVLPKSVLSGGGHLSEVHLEWEGFTSSGDGN